MGQMLYVGNLGDNTISTSVIDQESGLLTELKPRVASSGHPTSVAVHQTGKFVYVTNMSDIPNVAAYSIAADTDILTALGTVPLEEALLRCRHGFFPA